jgi:acetyl-CoA carboxylase carboxyl transferase subunit beta
LSILDKLKKVTEKINPDGFAKTVTKERIDIPTGSFMPCPSCKRNIFTEEYEKLQRVCPHCGYHFRIGARERLLYTVDKGSFQEWDTDLRSLNPIDFPGYEEKLEVGEAATDLNDAVISGECTIGGSRCAVFVMDNGFMMASMGSVVGEKITRCFERATEEGLPVVGFATSGGARMQEGIIALMQMAKTSGAVAYHSRAGLLYISVMTDPTTGGVTASFASLGDIIIAEPRALIGFAGRRVIEGTIRQKLPEDFQSAEFLVQHGFVDLIVPRNRMCDALSRFLKLHNAPEGGTDFESGS